jgi:hypothetical protein
VIRKTHLAAAAGAISLAAMLAVAAVLPVAAQSLGGPMHSGSRMLAPGLQLHAVNPSMSLSAPAPSPLQQQTQDDYATSLMDAQRQLLQQNPSGTSRSELSVGQQLNGFTGPR